MGDLNCDLLRPDLFTTKTLLSALDLGNLVVKCGSMLSPTRITASSSTCIDLIAVDKAIDLSRYAVVDFSVSDHLPVEADIEGAVKRKISPVRKRSFKGVDLNQLGVDVAAIRLNNVEDPSCLES